jgi:hypothetical protein
MYSRSLEKRTILLVALAFALLVFIIDSVAGAEIKPRSSTRAAECWARQRISWHRCSA